MPLHPFSFCVPLLVDERARCEKSWVSWTPLNRRGADPAVHLAFHLAAKEISHERALSFSQTLSTHHGRRLLRASAR